MESREKMEPIMKEQYNKGVAVGIELMMKKLRMAADNGTPMKKIRILILQQLYMEIGLNFRTN